MDRLLEHTRASGLCVDALSLVMSAAWGCDLATLQRLYWRYLDTIERDWSLEDYSSVLRSCSSSSAADWQAKVQWLERRKPGWRGHTELRQQMANSSEQLGLERLQQWLESRGYQLGAELALQAAASANMPVLLYMLDTKGVQLDAKSLAHAARCAASNGHLEVLQLLRELGYQIKGKVAFCAAAYNGQLEVASWLLEAGRVAPKSPEELQSAFESASRREVIAWLLERGCALHEVMLAGAAVGGSLEDVVWLRGLGCPWDEDVFRSGAAAGSEELLEWLAEHGCPMGDAGAPYLAAARNSDLATLACLKRLGCPWGPPGAVFTRAVAEPSGGGVWEEGHISGDSDQDSVYWIDDGEDYDDPYGSGPNGSGLPVLQWLAENDCPVDWGAALRAAERRRPYHPEEYAWVEAQCALHRERERQREATQLQQLLLQGAGVNGEGSAVGLQQQQQGNGGGVGTQKTAKKKKRNKGKRK